VDLLNGTYIVYRYNILYICYIVAYCSCQWLWLVSMARSTSRCVWNRTPWLTQLGRWIVDGQWLL